MQQSCLLLLKGTIEKCQNNFGRSILGYYVTTSPSKKQEGMRIIQAAAVSYYFEDGLSCWSRKPVAVPITAEVRNEASEAGQARARENDRPGVLTRDVECSLQLTRRPVFMSVSQLASRLLTVIETSQKKNKKKPQ